MPSAIQLQIKTSYEQNGMMPSEIASEFGYDVMNVKSVLISTSKQYRDDCGMAASDDTELGFSEDEERQALGVIHDITLCAEDDNVRLKGAIFIRNDRRGRLDHKPQNGNTFNILNINEALKAARETTKNISRKIEMSNSKTIEA